MNVNLNNFNTEELARIHNILNRWDWTDEIGNKPDNWDRLKNSANDDPNLITKYKIITPIMKEVKDKIGLKECLRWHHINNLDRTNEQFENWWLNEHDATFEV